MHIVHNLCVGKCVPGRWKRPTGQSLTGASQGTARNLSARFFPSLRNIVYSAVMGSDRGPASVRAYHAIRQQILDGAHPAGSRLREESLSKTLGVSRTPVREALRRLAGEGLIEFVPHRGAYVAVWPDTDLEEIFDLRARIESYAARRAATRASPAQVLRLRTLAKEMDSLSLSPSTTAVDEVAVLNNHFHGSILEAAESVRLVTMLGSLIQLPLVHHTFRRYSNEALRRSLAHHGELVDAIAVRDPDWAESVMHAHIRAALATLRIADGSNTSEGHV